MRHDMMSCGQVKKIKRHGLATMDQIKKHGFQDEPACKREGKARDLGAMDRRSGEAQVEGFWLCTCCSLVCVGACVVLSCVGLCDLANN